MKHIFMLLLCTLCAHLVMAQSHSSTALSKKHCILLSHLLQQQSGNSADMRTTAGYTEERVIAQSTRDSSGTLSDSVSVNYAPNMISTYDLNTMAYPYNYPYSTSPMFNYAGVFTRPQVFFDTCLHWTNDPFTLVYGLYEATYAGYDTHKNLVNFKDIFTDSVTNTNMSYMNRFNAANNIDSGYWFDLNAGVADSAFTQFFTYNSTGKLTEDSIYEYHLGTWHLVSKAFYTYDASNNLVQIDYYANDTDTTFTHPLIEREQYINTYDVSNRLTTVLTNMYNGTSLGGYVKDTFAYGGTHTYHNSWKEYQYDPINLYWAPVFNMSKTANAAGLPDTVNIMGYDSLLVSWVPQTMDVYSYNSFNWPDTMHEYDYNFTAFPSTPSYNTVYYYEIFSNNTLATKNITPVPGNFIIYPDPATDLITISQSGTVQKGLVSVCFMNVNGQMINHRKIVSQNEMQVSVRDLLPGMYWVVLQDESGNILHRQALVKQ